VGAVDGRLEERGGGGGGRIKTIVKQREEEMLDFEWRSDSGSDRFKLKLQQVAVRFEPVLVKLILEIVILVKVRLGVGDNFHENFRQIVATIRQTRKKPQIFDITVNAPLIVIPSQIKVMIVDCGVLTFISSQTSLDFPESLQDSYFSHGFSFNNFRLNMMDPDPTLDYLADQNILNGLNRGYAVLQTSQFKLDVHKRKGTDAGFLNMRFCAKVDPINININGDTSKSLTSVLVDTLSNLQEYGKNYAEDLIRDQNAALGQNALAWKDQNVLTVDAIDLNGGKEDGLGLTVEPKQETADEDTFEFEMEVRPLRILFEDIPGLDEATISLAVKSCRVKVWNLPDAKKTMTEVRIGTITIEHSLERSPFIEIKLGLYSQHNNEIIVKIEDSPTECVIDIRICNSKISYSRRYLESIFAILKLYISVLDESLEDLFQLRATRQQEIRQGLIPNQQPLPLSTPQPAPNLESKVKINIHLLRCIVTLNINKELDFILIKSRNIAVHIGLPSTIGWTLTGSADRVDAYDMSNYPYRPYEHDLRGSNELPKLHVFKYSQLQQDIESVPHDNFDNNQKFDSEKIAGYVGNV
jgi:hypothetical protein